jgi:DNA-binding LytR/AlgR family response regulator
MKTLIVEDNKMAAMATRQLLSGISFVELVGECENALEAVNFLAQNNVDLVLLDVEMPKMTGIDFLKQITKRPLVILVTAKTDYAVEAFEYNVVDYLVKPISQERLLKAILKAKELFDSTNKVVEQQDNGFLFVKEKGVLSKVLVDEITYIQALGDYLTIYTQTGKHVVHMTLKNFLERFPTPNFHRIHRSYIVALDKIDSIADDTAYIGKHPIPVGEVYKSELLKKLNLL